MAKVKHSLTPEQIELFFQTVDEYQTLLNLQNWRIERGTGKAQKGCQADVGISFADKLAVISIGDNWGQVVTDDMVADTAVHETLHIFTAELVNAARSRDESAIDSAEHSVVVLLTKLLK